MRKGGGGGLGLQSMLLAVRWLIYPFFLGPKGFLKKKHVSELQKSFYLRGYKSFGYGSGYFFAFIALIRIFIVIVKKN